MVESTFFVPHCKSWDSGTGSLSDYCSNAVTCNGVTVFVIFFVFFGVFNYIFGGGIGTGIEYNFFEVFTYLLSSFLKYSQELIRIIICTMSMSKPNFDPKFACYALISLVILTPYYLWVKIN